MKVLQLNFFFLRFVGIYSDVCEPTRIDFLKSLNGIYTLVGHLVSVMAFSAAYVYMNLSNLSSATYAMLVLVGGTGGVAGFIGMGMEMKSIKVFYTEIQAIVDRAKGTPAFKLYVSAERRSYLYTKWTMIILVWVCGSVMILSSVIYAFWNMIRGNWEASTYFLPLKSSIPFVDPNTINGFFFQLLMQIYGGFFYCTCVCTLTLYFVSCCLFIDACCQEFKQQFDVISEMISSENFPKNVMEIEDLLKAAITLHIKIMEYVHQYLNYHDEFECEYNFNFVLIAGLPISYPKTAAECYFRS